MRFDFKNRRLGLAAAAGVVLFTGVAVAAFALKAPTPPMDQTAFVEPEQSVVGAGDSAGDVASGRGDTPTVNSVVANKLPLPTVPGTTLVAYEQAVVMGDARPIKPLLLTPVLLNSGAAEVGVDVNAAVVGGRAFVGLDTTASSADIAAGTAVAAPGDRRGPRDPSVRLVRGSKPQQVAVTPQAVKGKAAGAPKAGVAKAGVAKAGTPKAVNGKPATTKATAVTVRKSTEAKLVRRKP